MATIPETYRAVRRAAGTPSLENPLGLEFSTEKTLPEGGLRSNDVLIRIHAVSLNYRDVSMLHGNYPSPVTPRGILASDCGAEVVAVGDRVTKFKVGDHVSPTFDLGNLTGEIGPEGHVAVGGDVDGVLREYAIFEEKYLVHLPKHLSWEEVSFSRLDRCTKLNN
jgi:NADPH:quinone reductase-like Zn-dependent oxidoreductase